MRSANSAAAWAEAQTTFLPINNCLRAVLVAYDVLGQIAPLARADATATEAWELATDKHANDRNPPRGALLCFPNWGAGKSGHIAIGLGGDRVRSTGIDSYAYFTGTIAQVAAACGNRYAGWAGDFAGRAIDFTSAAGGNSKPFPETPPDQGDGMRLTRDTDNNNAVVAGYALPPFWIRRSELGANYDAIAANAASIYSENPNRFPGEVLDQLFNDGVKANAQFKAQMSAPQLTSAQLAAIGKSIPGIDVPALVKAIAAADDDEHAALLAAVTKPRTLN